MTVTAETPDADETGPAENPAASTGSDTDGTPPETGATEQPGERETDADEPSPDTVEREQPGDGGETAGSDGQTPDDDDTREDADPFYDALETLGRPVVTATRYAQVRNCSQAEAAEELADLDRSGVAERLDVSPDPVVWYPSDWARMTDRERLVVFPERRTLVADQPTQFTRAQLTQFAHLLDTTGSGAYLYEIRAEDIWQAPYERFEDLLGTVRSVLPEREPALEEWLEDQYRRARQFTLRTHEDGYVVLEAASADVMGNVARQKLDDDQLRAPVSDTESWVAEERVAEVKRTLYEAGYPVRDERELERGDPLPVDLQLDLRPYQQSWVSNFLERQSGVLVGPPGSGKTVATLAILAEVEGETLILVPGRELAGQWREELLAHTTLDADQVGEYHGGEKTVRPVTISTYRTAGMDRHRHLFDSREWGLVVYDECLAGDTQIVTPQGRTTFDKLDAKHELSDGWNQIELHVQTYDTERSQYVFDDVRGIYKKEGAVYRIQTNVGHTLKTTKSHTHLVFNPKTGGIDKQNGVSVGDFLVRPQPETVANAHDCSNVENAKAELLGWFIGDGHANEYDDIKFSFGHHKSEQVAILTTLCERIGVEYSTFTNSRGDVTVWIPNLSRILDWQGPRGDKTGSVRVPSESYQWSPDRVGALLRGLFDAEGSVDKKGRIEFNTVSSQLADDVAELVQQLGILTRRIQIQRSNPDHRDLHRLVVPSMYGEQFLNRIGFKLQHKRERVDDGESPATGLPVGPLLQRIKKDTGLVNRELASMMGLSRVTVGGVIRGKYRLGQCHFQSLAEGLARFADENFENPEKMRKRHDISYRAIGDELGISTSTAQRRMEREHGETLSCLTHMTEKHKEAARQHSRQLKNIAGLNIVEVVGVEQVGEETVYDFETNSHRFVADGFLTHNCHHIPSPVHRRTANLQTRHRLGTTSTPLREDDQETDIFTLIGPPIGTDWEALFDAGYVAEPAVEIRYVPWNDEESQHAYVSATGHERRQLAASNPAKLDEVRALLAEAGEKQALVFVEYLDQGQAYADALDVPFISGQTPHHRREKLFEGFREGTRRTLVVSRVGDEGIDLPSAEVAIVASGLGGSRRQGTQRAGRTMRPTGRARMYVLATRGSREEDFARQRMQYLAEKGVRVTERDWVAGDSDSE